MIGVVILSTLLSLKSQVSAFSIPGLVPTNYDKGDRLEILAGPLESHTTELPFGFYEVKWCNNTVGGGYNNKEAAKNIKGTKLVHSPYDVSTTLINLN